MKNTKKENTPERAQASEQINAVIRSLQARERKYRAWQDNSMLIQKETGVYGTMRFLSCLYEDCVLMQYTGLKDKNGKEIYEGDIVSSSGIIKPGAIIQYSNTYNAFCIGSDWPLHEYMYDDPIQIIGNIFETSELLG